MTKIILHFSRNRHGGLFSKALQWYEGLPISHILVEFETPYLGQNFVYHSAIGSGVSFMTRKRFDKNNEIMETYEIELNNDQYNEIRNNLLDNCGEHYALWQNLGVLIVDQLRKIGIKCKNPWKNGQNCSELIYRYVISYIYKDQSHIFEPDLIKPSQIRKILKDNGISPIFSQI